MRQKLLDKVPRSRSRGKIKAAITSVSYFFAFLILLAVVTQTNQSSTLAPSPTSPKTATTASAPILTQKPTAEVKGEETQAEEGILVTKVVDGDTIVLENGEVVRYIGVDTPETADCYEQEATQKNRQFVEGKKVKLEKDVSERDRYGRLLRYVRVGNTFVNEYLVRQGYAQISTFPPDVKYQDLFLQAQTEARENDRGLWSNCKDNLPTKKSTTKNILAQLCRAF